MERPYRPLIKESRFRKLLRTVSRFLFYPALFAIMVPLYSLRIEGRKRLRGPAISVMNHCIYVEWFFLWHAVRPQYIRFTAEQANMQRRDAGWFNWMLGVIGIPSENPMNVAPAVSAALARGELVHFFPEGVLKERNQEPGGFFIGAAWFACRNDVPLIPVAEVLSTRKKGLLPVWWPPRVTLIVGDPIIPSEVAKKGERLRRTAQRITEMSEEWIRMTIREHAAR